MRERGDSLKSFASCNRFNFYDNNDLIQDILWNEHFNLTCIAVKNKIGADLSFPVLMPLD